MMAEVSRGPKGAVSSCEIDLVIGERGKENNFVTYAIGCCTIEIGKKDTP